MKKYNRIFIVGHSGAGKGLLAQEIARKLGWKFIDADFSLSSSIGRSISEIIGNYGEESLQECLGEILSYQKGMDNIVVTTDDSIVCNESNRQLLSSEFTVYLKVSTAVQLSRISHNRPLLPVEDYKTFLDNLRKERDALYEQVASFAISSDDNAIDAHVLSIIDAMKK